ncbi:MAG: efflux RND transporter periplasmic adaptor subunit, partial [Rubricoccaceae bacterium]|nr:efflux RND transporter periplasmic adaptor subunit [Rubricoccaceae bacterium]
DAQSRTFPVEIALNAGSERLQPDMVVRLSVSRAILDDVIALPLNAIVRDERGTSVYVAVENDNGLQALRRPVTLGPSSNGWTVVLDGVQANEQVIVSGQGGIEEGDLVRVLNSQGSAEAAMTDDTTESE